MTPSEDHPLHFQTWNASPFISPAHISLGLPISRCGWWLIFYFRIFMGSLTIPPPIPAARKVCRVFLEMNPKAINASHLPGHPPSLCAHSDQFLHEIQLYFPVFCQTEYGPSIEIPHPGEEVRPCSVLDPVWFHSPFCYFLNPLLRHFHPTPPTPAKWKSLFLDVPRFIKD